MPRKCGQQNIKTVNQTRNMVRKGISYYKTMQLLVKNFIQFFYYFSLMRDTLEAELI